MRVQFLHDRFLKKKIILGLIYRRLKYGVCSSSSYLSIYFVPRRVTLFLLPSCGLEHLTQCSFVVHVHISSRHWWYLTSTSVSFMMHTEKVQYWPSVHIVFLFLNFLSPIVVFPIYELHVFVDACHEQVKGRLQEQTKRYETWGNQSGAESSRLLTYDKRCTFTNSYRIRLLVQPVISLYSKPSNTSALKYTHPPTKRVQQRFPRR